MTIQIQDILKAGEPVYIQTVGRSMRPTFRNKVDYVEISPCETSTLQVGDVVFFDRGDQYCLHRIIGREGDSLFIRGDGNSHNAIERANLKDVAGKVTGGTMKGGKQFKITDPAWIRNTDFILKHHFALSQWHRLVDIASRYPFSIIVLLLVIYLSFMKTGDTALITPDADKYVHSAMYFGASLVFWYEWLRSHRKVATGVVLKGLVFCFGFPVLLGGLMELGQACLTEYRSGEWMDFVANTLGSLLATVVSMAVIVHIFRSVKYNNDGGDLG